MPFVRTAVIILTAYFKSKSLHRSIVPGEPLNRKEQKVLQDGEMVKEAFVEAADSLFRD